MPKKANNYNIKINLRNLIDKENLKANELQKITNQNQSQVYKWLNPYEVAFPTMEELLIICNRLGITLDELYEATESLNFSRYALYSNEFPGPRYYLSDKVLDASNCEDILKTYVNTLKIFIDKTNIYLKTGLQKDIPLVEAKKLLVIYFNFDTADEGIGEITDIDFECFKEFIDNKNYLTYPDDNPHFYPINANLVMLLYMSKNKKIVFDYLEQLKRLDDLFSFSENLKNKYVSEFYLLYEDMIQDEISDPQGKLFRKILEYGGKLGDESAYAKLIDRIFPLVSRKKYKVE